MNASLGMIFIIATLCLIPLSFVGSGTDTDRRIAFRIQRQKEAAMDWTDKQILEEERIMHKKSEDKDCTAGSGTEDNTADLSAVLQFAS